MFTDKQIERFAADAIVTIDDQLARKLQSTIGRRVHITKSNATEAIKEAYNIEVKNNPLSAVLTSEKDFEKAADAMIKAIREIAVSEKRHVSSSGRHVIFSAGSEGQKTRYLNKGKTAAATYLNTIAKTSGASGISDEGRFKGNIVEEHAFSESTVGLVRFLYALDSIHKIDFFSKFAKSSEFKSLSHIHGQLEYSIEYEDKYAPKRLIKNTNTWELRTTVGKKGHPVVETDWRKIKPLLQDAIIKYTKRKLPGWAKNQNITETGAVRKLLDVVKQNFEQVADTTVKFGMGKRPIPKIKKVIRKQTPVNKPTHRSARRKFFTPREEGAARISPLRLKTLIQAQLPKAMLKYMGNPPDQLVSRRGVFVHSAQIERITNTRRGMASIEYTYLKNPYEVFEPNRGAYPWNKYWQRDPKHIIGSAIRDIARQYTTDKFSVRRV